MANLHWAENVAAGDIQTKRTIDVEKRKFPLQRKVEWISTFRRDIFRVWACGDSP